MFTGTSSASNHSPVIHLHLTAASSKTTSKGASNSSSSDLKAQTQLLRRISDVALSKYGVLLSVPLYSCLDRVQPLPSLRLLVPATLSDKELAVVVAAVKGAAKEVLG